MFRRFFRLVSPKRSVGGSDAFVFHYIFDRPISLVGFTRIYSELWRLASFHPCSGVSVSAAVWTAGLKPAHDGFVWVRFGRFKNHKLLTNILIFSYLYNYFTWVRLAKMTLVACFALVSRSPPVH